LLPGTMGILPGSYTSRLRVSGTPGQDYRGHFPKQFPMASQDFIYLINSNSGYDSPTQPLPLGIVFLVTGGFLGKGTQRNVLQGPLPGPYGSKRSRSAFFMGFFCINLDKRWLIYDICCILVLIMMVIIVQLSRLCQECCLGYTGPRWTERMRIA